MPFDLSNANDVLCKNERLPREYSNHPSNRFSVNKSNRMCPFDRQLDTISKLTKTEGLSLPQLSRQQKQFHVYEPFSPSIYSGDIPAFHL